MTTITIQEAQSKLSDLIQQLKPGDEIVITENNRPVARLIAASAQPQRKLGTLKGTVTYMADDFDAPLDEFKEYMP
ncbi:MAG TPA: type II toxin-antitoxin system Phd/YefM family antitoxin [Planctomycetaceae bacterium]|nr:type II toxin-antitoxin system Phd/YefM family antitoxin [Planctomycetaceae bacterium]